MPNYADLQNYDLPPPHTKCRMGCVCQAVGCLKQNPTLGKVVEWLMALVLKTSEGASPPWVRIPPFPPACLVKWYNC